jgi:glycosyltransferase involved in cell wall biosynthesis
VPPLISCVVPTFNAGRYVHEALDSIAGQSYRPIEIVVADGGSTDDTLAICERDARDVRVVRAAATLGPAATRNLGLDHARGEFVAFLDPDDLWHPDKLRLQQERFERRPALEACVTLARLFWDEDMAAEGARYGGSERAGGVPGYATTTLLARRSLFDRIGNFDTGRWYSDATEWFIRAQEAGVPMEVVDQVLTYHRMHRSNLTRRYEDASRAEFLGLVRETLRRRRGGKASGVVQPYEFPSVRPTLDD